MRWLDRHVTLFSGSLRTLLQRESDRRRYVGSPYAWLFQPYMGEEQVALACYTSNGEYPAVSVAAVVLNQRHVQTSRAWVATIANTRSADAATLRRQHRVYGTTVALSPNAENLGALAEFIGNRPLIGWQIDRSLDRLNSLFKEGLGFGLPNAQVDVAKLHYRQLRRLHPYVDESNDLGEALERWQLPAINSHGVLSDAAASALLYIRLQRETVTAQYYS
ncbi:DNA polymerase III subunit epsilon [Halomonas sp. 7T]|uniref:DNA polymerase III subunit epsilon n=1 Tax=Halomonas sp. 7T TaxID=2893469 RepID=UPI0021D90702|nr:DNA polymerase III subunit epsilon [Halomonas sp. 7T]UXZ56128.1 DNA polymerase III subunit epsilon [Halomonas sp. 7T]